MYMYMVWNHATCTWFGITLHVHVHGLEPRYMYMAQYFQIQNGVDI